MSSSERVFFVRLVGKHMQRMREKEEEGRGAVYIDGASVCEHSGSVEDDDDAGAIDCWTISRCPGSRGWIRRETSVLLMVAHQRTRASSTHRCLFRPFPPPLARAMSLRDARPHLSAHLRSHTAASVRVADPHKGHRTHRQDQPQTRGGTSLPDMEGMMRLRCPIWKA